MSLVGRPTFSKYWSDEMPCARIAMSKGRLNAALTSLSLFQPLVMVESLDVWPKRESRRRSGTTENSEGTQVVNATMQLLSLRAVQ